MPAETPPAEPKLSPVEGIKDASRYLRGVLPDELAADTDHFSEDAKQLLKFHGSYQQEDRDARKNRPKGAAAGKAYMFMIRLKLPGGRLTAGQWLTVDDLAKKYANGTIRLTTRQSFQFHGILKGDLKATIAGFNAALVTSLGGCGDVNRNVLACPAPTGDPVRVQMQHFADEIARVLAPKAGALAYHEIWLNGEKQPAPETVAPEVAEPIYGKHYLPRKFKVAFALPEDNCTDILAQCLGFLAIHKNGEPVGYNVYVGGGQGQTNSRADTFAVPAKLLGFVAPEEVLEMAEAVVKFYRDHGDRTDRKRARLKYVVADWGIERVKEVFARDYWKRPLTPPVDAPDHRPRPAPRLARAGRRQAVPGPERRVRAGQGRRRVPAHVRRPRGGSPRSAAAPACRLSRTCSCVTSPRTSVAGWTPYSPSTAWLTRLRSPTCASGRWPARRSRPARWRSPRASGRCPASSTSLEPALVSLGLAGEPISVRMTGCPNGCARPYQSEIGLVGRGGTKYTLYVGGDSYGRRQNAELEDGVPIDKIPEKLTALFTRFKAERQGGELFGDYCERVGLAALKETVGAK